MPANDGQRPTTHSFWDSLKVGTRGEELLIQHYHEPLVVIPDRYADFRRVTDGKTVELKTDTYNVTKTQNYFFERYSDFHKKTPGGPWRARKDRVGVFVYYFVRSNLYFNFEDVKALCKEIERIVKRKKQGLILVKNRGYITAGYTIPRDSLAHLCTEHTFTSNIDSKQQAELHQLEQLH